MESTSSKVICEVCLQYKHAKKYRRHLRYHIRQGRITSKRMAEIIFQSRYSRLDSRIKVQSIKTGSSCNIDHCSAVVINLHTHLTKIHGLNPSDDLYINAMLNHETFQRRVFFRQNIHKRNPNLETNSTVTLSPQLLNNIEETSSTIGPLSEHNGDIEKSATVNYSTFDFPSYDSESDEYGENSAVYIPKDISHTISQVFLKSIYAFRKHSSTISGGSRSDPFIKMDFRNLICIINNVGEKHLFHASKLNIYISRDIHSGKSPSTLYSRLLSFSRFIEYLKIHKPTLLPVTKKLELLLSEIKGMITSLNKLNKKRQQMIMKKSRENYGNTIEVLKDWRKKRNEDNYLFLFDKYKENIDLKVSQVEYLLMRNFLITELIIPNGLRPGVISGVTIEEIVNARTNTTEEGYHKILVASHKTGNIQTAILFVYPEVFYALYVFVDDILRRLPLYNSHTRVLTNTSFVFQSFTGQPILSPRVTPILRKFLSQMDISYSGTLTDLRKAAATLTGKFDPKLNDVMSLFLCHSRKAHDRYYQMNMGHNGLADAFKSLENFQTSPDSRRTHIESDNMERLKSTHNISSSVRIPNVGDSDISQNSFSPHESLSISNAFHQTSTPINPSVCSSTVATSYLDDTHLECTIGHTEKAPKLCDYSSSTVDSQSSMSMQSISDIVYPHLSNLADGSCGSSDIQIAASGEPTLRSSETLPHRCESINTPDIANDNWVKSTINSGRHSSTSLNLNGVNMNDKGLKMKSCYICLIDVFTEKQFRCRNESGKIFKRHPKRIFMYQKDDDIFRNVFSELICSIANKMPAPSSDILERAYCSYEFSPVLEKLYETYPEKIVNKMIINKVRSLGKHEQHSIEMYGSQIDDSYEEVLVDLSFGTRKYIRDKRHNKSIFYLKKDEVLFQSVFSDLIHRVTNRQYVSKVQILDRTNDIRFRPVMTRLKSVYSEGAYKKILNKVRTVGISKRPQ